jgi:hypothetical protein
VARGDGTTSWGPSSAWQGIGVVWSHGESFSSDGDIGLLPCNCESRHLATWDPFGGHWLSVGLEIGQFSAKILGFPLPGGAPVRPSSPQMLVDVFVGSLGVG